MSEKKVSKPRAPPFTDMEIAILMSCLEQWKNVIECTETDQWSMRTKKEAWEQVTDEYEEECLKRKICTPRTTEQLKNCWKNSKAKFRKIDSEEKTHAILTGGGPAHSTSTENEFLVAMVRNIRPTIDLTLENKWDSTAAFEETVDLTTDEVETNENNESQDFDDSNNDLQGIDFDNHCDDKSDVQALAQEKMAKQARRENLINEMNERKAASAKPKGFCKPANASFKNRKSHLRTTESILPASSQVDAPAVKGQGSKKKLTTSQTLGHRMGIWEASLARAEEDDARVAKPSTSASSPPAILENRIKKCQEHVHPDDPRLFPKRMRMTVAGAEAEQSERLKRAEDARVQQAELHQARMGILGQEKLYWAVKLEIAQLEKEHQISIRASNICPTLDRSN
ncbi:hypothetical protein QAD02_013831 [Eretmocerus hayati]|uniref:Uncharacterized protein n=1 Tax=Eretmocerus hayati TaxID=131215 RepID=A0ACC2P403_9HYME|nr:hypothetical protein QAD02_013831 [Eretmocerus hayati]